MMTKKKINVKVVRMSKNGIRQIEIHTGARRIRLVLDKILFLRFFGSLHGRFWGVMSVQLFFLNTLICFAIRPDMLKSSTAISDFSTDFRTAPFFIIGILSFCYGQWRWRNYLNRTINSSKITLFMTTMIFGFLLVAIFSNGWYEIPARLHGIGLIIATLSIAATVIADTVRPHFSLTKFEISFRYIIVTAMLAGLIVTSLSTRFFGFILDKALLGEGVMILSYYLWIIAKTSAGERGKYRLIRMLFHFGIIKIK